MLRSSAHIIATGRSKTETAQVDDHGRKKVVKLGMRLESRDGAEYEFTTVLDIVHDGHFAVASKDRTGIFGGDPKPISVETGERLAAWLAGGTPAAKPPSEKYAQAADYISRAATDADLRKATRAIDGYVAAGQLTGDEWSSLTDQINERLAAIETTAGEPAATE
jgi:hypothetical protein